MIDPKRLTEADKGRRVMYMGYPRPEYGIISSWNDKYIFVIYEGLIAGQATHPKDLNWSIGTYQDGGTE